MTYDYECTTCEKTHEVSHSVSDTSEHLCPDCGSVMHKLISAVAGIIFKGSGFHSTDYPKEDRCAKRLAGDPSVVKAAERFMHDNGIRESK